MAQLLIANIGSYPRIGDSKDQQRHRRGYAHFERKEISAHAFRDVEQSVAQEIIREQIERGLDEVTDGLIGWQDPIRQFCKNVSGIESTGLARYFNTNFYYRVPVFTARPKLKGPVLKEDFEFAASVSTKPLRSVLTGPFTLATHTASDIKTFRRLADRTDFFVDLIGREIAALIAVGAQTIQIDEPSLARDSSALPQLKKALEKWTAEFPRTKFILALYFAPLAPLWDALQTLPVRGLNLDFTVDGDKLFDKILAKPGSKEIGFGWIDAHNTKMEPVDEIAGKLKRFSDAHPHRTIYLTPSAGLELLPRHIAAEKLTLLAKIRDAAPQKPVTEAGLG